MKIKKFEKRKNIGILLIVILQIFIMINMTTAESYFISEGNKEISYNNISDNKNKFGKTLIKKSLGLLIGVLDIKEIGIVSAESLDGIIKCCVSDPDVGVCVNYAKTENVKCQNSMDTSCDKVSECNPGCCIDESFGTCSPNAPKKTCPESTEKKIRFEEGDKNCGTSECLNGCCLIGNDAIFTNNMDCKIKAGDSDYEFLENVLEPICLMIPASRKEGACVIESGGCKRTTGEECKSPGTTFHEGFLCSYASLNTGCTEKSYKICVDGKDEIYWFDSCDNQENIVGTDSSDGKIKTKQDSCGYGKDNINGDCGNCDRNLGSACSEKSKNNFVCKDLKCYNAPILGPLFDTTSNGVKVLKYKDGKLEYKLSDKPKNNYERWCLYDSNIGQGIGTESGGTDTVGSEHWLAQCVDGEVKVVKCGDARSEVCQEWEIKQEATGEIKKDAACVMNQGPLCYNINKEFTNTADPLLFQAGLIKELCYINAEKSTPCDDSLGEQKKRECEDLRNLQCNKNYANDVDDAYTSAAQKVRDICNTNSHCTYKWVDVQDKNEKGSFRFGVCTQRYPVGLDLQPYDEFVYGAPEGMSGNTNTNGPNPSAITCSKATVPCTVKKINKGSNKYDIVYNGDCTNPEMFEKMNDFCISVGDCGSYVNYIGRGTDSGARIEGADRNVYVYEAKNREDDIKKIWWIYYSYFNNVGAVEGQFVNSQPIENIREFFSSGTDTGVGTEMEGGAMSQEVKNGAVLAEVLGSVTGVFGTQSVVMLLATHGENLLFIADISGELGAGAFFSAAAPFAGAAIGSYIGGELAKQHAEQTGIVGDYAELFVFAGAMAGASIGYALVAYFIVGAEATSPSVIGPIIVLAIAVLTMVWIKAANLGKLKDHEVKFSCLQWQAPNGGDDCHICNEDPWKPCNRYRCDSLGQLCKLLNEEETNPPCVNIGDNDNKAPDIKEIKILTSGYSIKPEGADLFRQQITGCISESDLEKGVQFEVDLSEYAQCIWSLKNTGGFDLIGTPAGPADTTATNPDSSSTTGTGAVTDSTTNDNTNEESVDETEDNTLEIMDTNNYPSGVNLYLMNHTFTLNSENMPSVMEMNPTGNEDVGYQGDGNIYIYCKDASKQENTFVNPLVIKYCVTSTASITAAYLKFSKPDSQTYIASYNTTEQYSELWFSRPLAEPCHYSKTPEKKYEEMESVMENCASDYEASDGAKGYKCEETFTGLTAGENKFYIKCKNNQQQINTIDIPYSIKVTQTPLQIISTAPSGDKTDNKEPVEFILEARTSGGAENGRAGCEFYSNNQWVGFLKTWTSNNIHTQPLNFYSGQKIIPVKCTDAFGNSAESEIKFSLSVDNNPPIITRMYLAGSTLKIVTNENARCKAVTDKCSFDYKTEGTAMDSSPVQEHSITWSHGKTYYIICSDEFGNTNPTCAAQISPTTIR